MYVSEGCCGSVRYPLIVELIFGNSRPFLRTRMGNNILPIISKCIPRREGESIGLSSPCIWSTKRGNKFLSNLLLPNFIRAFGYANGSFGEKCYSQELMTYLSQVDGDSNTFAFLSLSWKKERGQKRLQETWHVTPPSLTIVTLFSKTSGKYCLVNVSESNSGGIFVITFSWVAILFNYHLLHLRFLCERGMFSKLAHVILSFVRKHQLSRFCFCSRIGGKEKA